MKGLALSKQYYEECGKPMIKKHFPEEERYMAFGLVGEGSECYGYDDEFSKDHDFGPKFCIWLPEEKYKAIGKEVAAKYAELPRTYLGYRRNETKEGIYRNGVHSIERFFFKYTGCKSLPEDNAQWFKIPESFLSTATNGEVFDDYLGTFSSIYQGLQEFYPEDVIKKKLAAKVAIMAQSGQYNYVRAIQRGEYEAAYLSLGEFVRNTLGVIFLLNKVYMPFYKWTFKMGKELPQLKSVIEDLRQLIALGNEKDHGKEKIRKIESICLEIGKILGEKGYSKTRDPFLHPHSIEIMEGISDNRLRQLHLLADSRG